MPPHCHLCFSERAATNVAGSGEILVARRIPVTENRLARAKSGAVTPGSDFRCFVEMTVQADGCSRISSVFLGRSATGIGSVGNCISPQTSSSLLQEPPLLVAGGAGIA